MKIKVIKAKRHGINMFAIKRGKEILAYATSRGAAEAYAGGIA